MQREITAWLKRELRMLRMHAAHVIASRGRSHEERAGKDLATEDELANAHTTRDHPRPVDGLAKTAT